MTARRRFPFARLMALLVTALAWIPAGAGNTPEPSLVSVAGRGDLNAVNALLGAGADVNYRRTDSGVTALMAAAAAGHVGVTRALIAAGARVNIRNTAGCSAMLDAVMGGHLEVVKELIAAKADPDICASGAGPLQPRGPLMFATLNGNLKMANLLLEGGADVNATTSYGATPLRFAISGGGSERVAMVKALLARGADVDAGHAPAYKVTGSIQARVAFSPTDEVVVAGSRTHNAEGTALGDVATSKNSALVKVLLDAGAKVDARQPGWKTPLMIAAAAGNLPVVRLLLDAGADVNAKDSSNSTALDLALANGREDVAQLLRNIATVRRPQ